MVMNPPVVKVLRDGKIVVVWEQAGEKLTDIYACIGDPLSPVPAVPGPLQATVSGTTATLSWQDNSDNEDGFRVYLKVGEKGSFNLLGEAGSEATSYVHAGLTAGTEYYYYVTAYRYDGESLPSNGAAAKP